MVECIHCGESFVFAEIENHIDNCEKKNASEEVQEHEETVETVQGAPTENAGRTPVNSLHGSLVSTSAGTHAGTSERARGNPRGNSAQTLLAHEWITEPDLNLAASIYRRQMLTSAQERPDLVATLDMAGTEEDRERQILSFYKLPAIDWTSPFSVTLKGDAAVGDGVKRHLFSTTVDKIQFGFDLDIENTGKTLLFNRTADHKVPSTARVLVDGDLFRVAGRIIGHSFLHGGPQFTGMSPAIIQQIVGNKDSFPVLELADCPDTDVIDVVSLVESERELTEAEKSQVNSLAVSWDLPFFHSDQRRWLAEAMLHHAVIGRRKKQIKQLRKGLQDTGVLNMIKERLALAAVPFPRSAAQIMDSEYFFVFQMILKRIIWPMEDSEDENIDGNVEEACLVTGFLRCYIEKGTSEELHRLIQFWTGWTILPQHLYVEVSSDLTLPVASTCLTTLKLPLKCCSYEAFTENLQASVRSTKFGFGRI
ncbi:hypothetical protein GJAV_G00114420 [Gymnothorax javanicus]|nr:hypothetical protein GJAV_G00114420 [Gymnothorax javanicus]